MRNVYIVVKFGVFYSKKHLPDRSEWAIITSQKKMSNNFEAVRDMRTMGIKHDYETVVALSDFVNKSCTKHP